MGRFQTLSISEVIQRLQFFNEKSEELKKRTFLTKASAEDAGFTIRMTPETVKAERRGADEEATAALVLTLRFFLQPRDGIQIEEIVSLYQELPIPQEDKHCVLENFKSHVKMLDAPTAVVLAVDGEEITNRAVLETFMYGCFAHSNEDKRSKYLLWQSTPIRLFFDDTFEYVVCEVLRYVFWLSCMNIEVIKHLEVNKQLQAVSYDPAKKLI